MPDIQIPSLEDLPENERLDNLIEYILGTDDINTARLCYLAEFLFKEEVEILEKLAFCLTVAATHAKEIRSIFPKTEH